MTLSQEQYVVDSNGTKTAVILTIEQYEQLLEDLHDLAIVAERRSEQPRRRRSEIYLVGHTLCP
jgi:PHD/YefM family antitoxin component YafN of YafNO toxin-antitoxin module